MLTHFLSKLMSGFEEGCIYRLIHNAIFIHWKTVYVTPMRTLSHLDPVFPNDLIDSFFSTNPLLAQMPSTVYSYHMLYTYGIHFLRGSSHPHSVLLKL